MMMEICFLTTVIFLMGCSIGYSLAFSPSLEGTECTKLCHHKSSSNNNDRRSFVTSSIASTTTILTTHPLLLGANAITPEQASKSYDKYATTYDNLDGGSIASSLGINDARKNLLSGAYGHVLEIGVGTGLNLDSYNFDNNNIKSLTCVDISEGMLSQAKIRMEQILMGVAAKSDNVPAVKFVKADATSELLSLFGEDSFDTVVDTFSLCVMGNEGAKLCLNELAGVVKKSGE